jgi:aerobic carbon-monoxide dehydrogenase large subunit
VPQAGDAPSFAFETRRARTSARLIPWTAPPWTWPARRGVNPWGAKGAGEAGTIGAAPAVMNAIVDALYRAFRIRRVDMPATPERLWAAIREGKRVHTL